MLGFIVSIFTFIWSLVNFVFAFFDRIVQLVNVAITLFTTYKALLFNILPPQLQAVLTLLATVFVGLALVRLVVSLGGHSGE